MANTYYFPRRELKRIEAAAGRADIRELCYLVFGRGGRIRRAIRVPNRAADPVMHHVISTRDWERVRRGKVVRQLHCLGFLHTHPVSHAVPGPGDLRGYSMGTLLFIYSDVYQKLRAFRLAKNRLGYVEKFVVIV